MPPRLDTHPIHLGLGAKAISEPAMTGFEWYGGYEARHAADGAEGRLVSCYEFSVSWDSWEMHPAGDEVVYLISGAVQLVQEFPDGRRETARLAAGEYTINPPGVWHTMDLETLQAQALFITAGIGTQHRPR